MMEFEESVSVQLTLEPESDDMEPCADPLPMEMNDLGDLGRMKYGSLQRPQSHLLPSGSPMHSGVRKS